MCDPQVRFCERPGGESPRAYSTDSGAESADAMDGRGERPATGHGRPRSHRLSQNWGGLTGLKPVGWFVGDKQKTL